MRNITVTVTDETYKIARIWAAQRDKSLSSVVAELLRTLPNIEQARRALPPSYITNAGRITPKADPITATISSASAQNIAPDEPAKKLKFASETVEVSANLSN
jgi:hypothetical protein